MKISQLQRHLLPTKSKFLILTILVFIKFVKISSTIVIECNFLKTNSETEFFSSKDLRVNLKNFQKSLDIFCKLGKLQENFSEAFGRYNCGRFNPINCLPLFYFLSANIQFLNTNIFITKFQNFRFDKDKLIQSNLVTSGRFVEEKFVRYMKKSLITSFIIQRIFPQKPLQMEKKLLYLGFPNTTDCKKNLQCKWGEIIIKTLSHIQRNFSMLQWIFPSYNGIFPICNGFFPFITGLSA
eukprot:TRINITY_DN13808_c0_g3_i1.p1 TRINITY_DN13808_c0_g3~~TRINITY_DN13808_c0_g3_i1.p1  ORF type:complete len:239 (-),score=-7.62 TRINITY_DN13808_c0_g3_i1:52-768(-)